MSANLVALARMAAGRVEEAIPLFEDVMARIPDMSFRLPTCCAPAPCWVTGREWIVCWHSRPRDPCGSSGRGWTSSAPSATRRRPTRTLARRVRSAGSHDRLRGRVATRLHRAPSASWTRPMQRRSAPDSDRVALDDDIMGPDAYRHRVAVQAGMPELRTTRASPPVRNGSVWSNYWTTSGQWPDCATPCPMTSARNARGFATLP